MKQPPKYIYIQNQMKEGELSLAGFLGNDTRPLIDILQSDDEIVHQLGFSHNDIAVKMNELLILALKTPGELVDTDYELKIKAEEFRGSIPCPFGHQGLYPKNHIVAYHKGLNKYFYWSSLSIHLIEKHGFYQGVGALYHINPKDLAYILRLI